jgi:hypothetical protein
MNKKYLFRIIPAVLIVIFLLVSPFYGADKKLVILPFNYTGDPSKTYLVQTIKKMLSTKLSGEGIGLVDEEQYNSILTGKEKEGIIPENKIKEIAGKLKANFVVYGSVTSAGATASIDLFILDIDKQNSSPSKISNVVSEDQLIVKTADMSGQIKAIILGVQELPGKSESGADMTKTTSSAVKPLTSLNITGDIPIKNTQIMAFDIADLDGDGNSEWLILEAKSLMIYIKENGVMVKKDSLESSIGETFLKVSAGDVDGNGKPEIYVTTLYGQIVRTVVWEWPGKFIKLFDNSGNLRVIKETISNKSILLFQDSSADNPFFGAIQIMQYGKDGKLAGKESLKQLKNVQFYTLIFMDYNNDGNMEYAGLDNNSCLNVWDKDGKSIWRGKDEMGGTNNFITINVGLMDILPDATFFPYVQLNSRLAIMDIDKDGKNEIIVVHNIPALSITRLKEYEKGSIKVFKADGKKFVNTWTSDEIDDCITDIQIDGDKLFLSTESGHQALIFKGTSHILWFD